MSHNDKAAWPGDDQRGDRYQAEHDAEDLVAPVTETDADVDIAGRGVSTQPTEALREAPDVAIAVVGDGGGDERRSRLRTCLAWLVIFYMALQIAVHSRDLIIGGGRGEAVHNAARHGG